MVDITIDNYGFYGVPPKFHFLLPPPTIRPIRPRLQQSSHASGSLQVPDVGLHGTEGQGTAATIAIGVLQGSDFYWIS